MNFNQIESIFGVLDFNSGTPIYRQIEEHIAGFIKNAANNTPLPPEREVAAALKINRRTLRRAIDPFVKSGLLSRGIKGTVVKKFQEELPSADSRVHPFNFSAAPFLCPGKTVRLALYENMPLQRQLWETLVEIYNSEKNGSKVTLDWIPLSVTTVEKYRDFIMETKPDIMQASFALPHQELANEMAEELPADLKKLIHSETCWSHLHEEHITPILPVHFSLHAFCVNTDLLEKFSGCKVHKEPFEIERQLLQLNIPGNIKTAFHIDDYYGNLSLGTIPPAYDENGIKNFLTNKFEYIMNLPRGMESRLGAAVNEKVYDIYKSMNFFVSRNVLSTSAFPMFIADSAQKMGFPYSIYLPELKKNVKLLTGISGVMVNSFSEDKEFAWDFARFLLFEKIQKLFPEKLKNAAMIRNANDSLAAFCNMTASAFNSTVSKMKTSTSKDYDFGWKLAEIRDRFYLKLYKKEIGTKEAAETAVDKLKEEKFL